MARKFKTADYEATLGLKGSIKECLPPEHLARFIVNLVAQLDLSSIYNQYGVRGGEAFAPEILLGLLFYGYATGTFSCRQIEQATYESIPFRFIAGNNHPDHDTIANFRCRFLPQIKDLFVQVLLIAQRAGVLKLGNISLDGTKIHANASKSKAVSYQHLLKLEERLQAEVEELLALSQQAEGGGLPEGLEVEAEIAWRQERLLNLGEAKAVLEQRAEERYQGEQKEYEAKMQGRGEKQRQTGRKPGGRPPQPPTPGARDKDQYNFTDPDSRVMKNANNKSFDQHYNAQAAVAQESLLIVAATLSNQPSDRQQAIPTLEAISPQLGQPERAALDNGYFSANNIEEMERREIDPYIATGREPHHRSWKAYFAEISDPPSQEASLTEKMAYKLKTEVGQAIYRLRKCTVEPVLGIIKEVLGFRQFSLRGLEGADGEWTLVCLAFNLKRLQVLLITSDLIELFSPTNC